MSSAPSDSIEDTQTSTSAYSQPLLDSSTQDNESSQVSSVPAPVPTQRSRQPPRLRFSYAKRKLYAPHTFLLDPTYTDRFQQSFPSRDMRTPLVLEGQIIACPTTKNGHMYVVSWDQRNFPTLNPQWVRPQFTSSPYIKEKLQQFIVDFDKATLARKHESQRNNATAHPATVTQTATAPQQPLAEARTTTNKPSTTVEPDRRATRTTSPLQQGTNERTTSVPNTIERARRRAALTTATGEESSPAISNLTDAVPPEANNDNTPRNDDSRPIRLFGSGSTTAPAQPVDDDNNVPRRSRRHNQAESSDSSDSDEDNGDEDLEPDTQQPRSDNPLDEVAQSDTDEAQAEDAQEGNEGANVSGANNQTSIRQLMDALSFAYHEISMSTLPSNWIGKEDNHKSLYKGPDGLRPGVSDNFSNPWECFQFVGGLSSSTIARMATATNMYFDQKIKPNLLSRRGYYHSQRWENVTIEEMTRFLGIILMMSLRPVDGGGYAAHFQTSNRVYNVGAGHPLVEIKNSTGWASQYMKLARFRQIRGAFHLEEESSRRGGDKCHQLRKFITSMNAASRRSFYVPKDLAFDEGGIGCRSRYCPARQYNKDKPQKFRVDFFILSSSSTYAILHLDVYQGANATNSYIHQQALNLPTTMKAVVNACYQLEMHKLTDGYRHVSMDNRYCSPKLAVILRDRLRIFSTGTCRANRVGWDKNKLNLKKGSDNRGAVLLYHDAVNGLVLGQWVDSKTVNFVSSFEDSGSGTVLRQVGSEKRELTCPVPLIRYQNNMGGVDNGDQMRFQFGGFANVTHFKKWYKKAGLAILDCMLLNSYIAWNLSAGDRLRS